LLSKKTTCAKLLYSYWLWRFENKKTDRIVNIDKEKYEIYSLHVNSCYDNM
jgi:hypothetical protein